MGIKVQSTLSMCLTGELSGTIIMKKSGVLTGGIIGDSCSRACSRPPSSAFLVDTSENRLYQHYLDGIKSICMYVYMYVCIYMYVYIYIV